MFPLPFLLIHLLAFPTGFIPYALLPMMTTELSFYSTISRLLVLLKSYDPLSLFFISLTSANEYFSIRIFVRLTDDSLSQIHVRIDFMNSYYPTNYICRLGCSSGGGFFLNCSIEKLSSDFTSITQARLQELSFFTHRYA